MVALGQLLKCGMLIFPDPLLICMSLLAFMAPVVCSGLERLILMTVVLQQLNLNEEDGRN